MTKVYACLIGEWVCLNEDPSCRINGTTISPDIWWEEGAKIWAPLERTDEHTMYQLDYVNILYQGKNYRINPAFIQIVTE